MTALFLSHNAHMIHKLVNAIISRARALAGRAAAFARDNAATLGAAALLVSLTLLAYHTGRTAELSRYVAPGRAVGITMALRTLWLAALVHALGRSCTKSIFAGGLREGKRVLLVALGAVILAALLTPLGRLLGLRELSMLHHLLAFALAGVPLLLSESVKAVADLRRFWRA